MNDKKYHIIAGLVIAVFVGIPCYAENYDLFAGLWSALAGSLVAAAVKEYCDAGYRINVTEWDWKDIAATMVGAAIVALFIVGMHFCKG